MRYHFAVAACLVLAGCSSSRGSIGPDPTTDGGPSPVPTQPGPGEGPTSGTRLKQRIQKGADGSKAFVGWYDSQRDEECSFIKATDGKTRCLPNAPIATNGPYFSGATCTSPVFVATKGCAAPKVVLVQEGGDQCTFPRAVSVRYITNKIPDSAQLYLIGAGGACTSTAVPSTNDFYGIGATLVPGDFVEGSEERL